MTKREYRDLMNSSNLEKVVETLGVETMDIVHGFFPPGSSNDAVHVFPSERKPEPRLGVSEAVVLTKGPHWAQTQSLSQYPKIGQPLTVKPPAPYKKQETK